MVAATRNQSKTITVKIAFYLLAAKNELFKFFSTAEYIILKKKQGMCQKKKRLQYPLLSLLKPSV